MKAFSPVINVQCTSDSFSAVSVQMCYSCA